MPPPDLKVVGVHRLTEYLRLKMQRDPHMQRVGVRGEVTNFVERNGNLYFSLKEGDALLYAFAWRNNALNFPPMRNGIAVIAVGAVEIYPKNGRHQLNVVDVELAGAGDVHAQFEERKKRLMAEGLFEPERKRPLPAFPFAVALVSSRSSDGAIDFVSILRERAPHVRVLWCETAVQGAQAAAEIATAVDRASRMDADAIVVTRGGGSFEDLFVFSDETLVRAIARARHPVISAIGHTADMQLSDLVADRHFKTPSDAAKALGRDTFDLLQTLESLGVASKAAVTRKVERLEGQFRAALVRSRLSEPRLFFVPLAQRVSDGGTELENAAQRSMRSREVRLRELERRLIACDPQARLAEHHVRFERAQVRLYAAAKAGLDARGARLSLLGARLDGRDPDAILAMGYARVTYDGSAVVDASTVPAGAAIEARVARGTLHARVERTA